MPLVIAPCGDGMEWMPSSPRLVAPQFLQPLNALASKYIGESTQLMYDSIEDLQIEHDKKCKYQQLWYKLVIVELFSKDNTKQSFYI